MGAHFHFDWVILVCAMRTDFRRAGRAEKARSIGGSQTTQVVMTLCQMKGNRLWVCFDDYVGHDVSIS